MNVFLAIVGAIVLCIALWWLYEKCDETGHLIGSVATGIVGIVVFVMAFSFSVIPTGSVGSLYQFGVLQESESDCIMGAGLQWNIPFVQSIKQVDVMQQNANEFEGEDDRVWGESKDKLPVYCRDVRVTYQINPEGVAFLLKNVSDIEELSAYGKTVQSSFAAATPNFSDVDVCKQSMVEPVMLEEMQRITDAKYGSGNVTIIRVLIGELDYEPDYQDAITERKNAEQKAIQQEVANQTAIDKAIADAKAKEEKANGEAEAKKIKADAEAYKILTEAEAQAEANKKLVDSLTPMLIANNWIVQWDGKMPVVTDSSGNIIDISELLK